MGYIIEVSFNIFKNSNVTEIEEEIISFAKKCNSTFFYSNCEMEKNIGIQRNHLVITAHFEEKGKEDKKMEDLLCFLNYIKKQKGIYIESIYNEETNQILYASQYYLTMMDKFLSKKYQTNKRSRSYSEDETIILNKIDKNPQKIVVKN
jgi:hypothetical protein